METHSVTQRRAIEAAVRKVFEDGCEAWNRGDLDGYLAGYWDSEKTIWISSGTLTRGKAAIVKACKARFSTPATMGRLTIADLEIDVLTDSDAMALGRWILEMNDRTSSGFFTVQLKQVEGAWVYVSDHSSTQGMP